MPEHPIQRLYRERLGLRIESEMAEYVLRRLKESPAGAIPVMGSDARTGLPVRREVDLRELATLLKSIGDAAL